MQLLVVNRVSVYADVGRSPGLCWSCGSSTRGGRGGTLFSARFPAEECGLVLSGSESEALKERQRERERAEKKKELRKKASLADNRRGCWLVSHEATTRLRQAGLDLVPLQPSQVRSTRDAQVLLNSKACPMRRWPRSPGKLAPRLAVTWTQDGLEDHRPRRRDESVVDETCRITQQNRGEAIP